MDYDFDHPLNTLNRLESALLAADMHCIWCEAEHTPVPMGGTDWGVETFHQPECPEHEDNQPANEVQA
jgi:hypothetical protein